MRKLLGLFLLCGLMASSAYAESFKILGARAVGMGGASVALVGDNKANSEATTQYWNPGALSLHADTDIELPISVGLEATGGLLNYAKDISDLSTRYDELKLAQDNGSYLTLAQIESFTKALKNLDGLNADGLGILADADAGLNMSIGKFAISVNSFNSVGADPTVDLTNLFLGDVNAGVAQTNGGSGAVTTGAGVDLSQIPGINIAAPASAELQQASANLAPTIQNLVDLSGVSTGAYTSAEISNAIVNYASQTQGVSQADIVSAASTIKENEALVSTVLAAVTQGTSFSNNNSKVGLQGISMNEVAFGYGVDLGGFNEKLKFLNLGASVKYIQGKVGYYQKKVWESDAVESNDVYSDARKNIKTTTGYGVDLGMLMDFKKEAKTRFGLVAKNINRPSFDRPQLAIDNGLADKYKVDPQYRAGAAFWPANWFVLAFDYDLTENKTQLEGFNSRYMGGGVELNLINKEAFNLALRVGTMKNVAISGSKPAYTAGIGVNFLHLIVELSGAYSTDTVLVEDGDEIPASARGALSIGVNF